MNKKVLALAISAAAVSTIHAAEIYSDNNGYSLEMGGRAEARMAVRDGNVEDNSRVRLNLLGTAEITDNLYGVGFYEGEFTTADNSTGSDLDNRYGYAGIGGAFGEVTYGKNDGALGVITDFTDIMMYHGNTAAHKLAVADRTDNMVSYKGSFDDLDIKASYRFADLTEIPGNDAIDSNDMDGYSLSAIYNISTAGVALGAGYAAQEDDTQYNVALSYTMNDLYFAGIYTNVDFDGDEYTGFELAAAYTMGQMKFTSTYNNAELESMTVADNFAIDAAYFFKPNFYGYASYNLNLLDSDEVGNIASQDEIALGLRFDF